MDRQGREKGVEESEVNFDYIKGQQFRVIRADGAVGGVTPNGHIHFALFSERRAIPRQSVHPINDDGTLGEELSERRVSRGGFVREMDVDVFVTVDVAENFCAWLQEKIEEAKKRQIQPEQIEDQK